MAVCTGIGVFKLVDAIYAMDQKEKKYAQQKKTKSLFQEMLEIETINAPYFAVQQSLHVIEEGIEIVKIGDEYYTNLPAVTT